MLKSCPAQIKAAGTEDGLELGQFKALVSVFGNKDSYGDVVQPGAFAETLEEWKASGDSIPVYWSHQMNDPMMNIGWVVSAEETEKGLEVLAQLDTEEGASPVATQAYRLLKGRRVREFSFAYDVLDGGTEKSDEGDEYYALRKLKLYEVGPTPVGANSETELLGVKRATAELRAGLKAGRVISAKNEAALTEAVSSLEASIASIKNVLAAVASDDGDDGKASTAQEQASASGPAKDEEPSQAKSEEPNRGASVDTWAATLEYYERTTA